MEKYDGEVISPATVDQMALVISSSLVNTMAITIDNFNIHRFDKEHPDILEK
jgi:hypothetical protein